jgi:cellulose synthase/poly-beta-1,6-N-acetylglucosamine synthase-like glycosyltransferase
LIAVLIGLNRLGHTVTDHLPTVSIVIAARDEEKRIGACLRSLENLDYPTDKYEVIIVDDNSADNTADLIEGICRKYSNWMLIRLKQKSAELRGKKNALQTGISKAKGELIFTTDADCIVPSKWLRIMVHYFTPDVSMVLGYSPLIREVKPYFRLLQFDNLFSAIAAAAPAKLGYPFTSVGRNLVYRKSDYETSGGFQALKKFRSGDDIHLTKRFRYHNGGKIDYCAEPETFVLTMIPSTLKEVFQQQIRKNSKTFQLSFTTIVSMLVVFLFYLFLILVPFLVPALFAVWIVLITIKFILEYFTLRKAALIFRQSDLIPIIPLMQIIYPMYIIFFSFIGSFQFYQWKK